MLVLRVREQRRSRMEPGYLWCGNYTETVVDVIDMEAGASVIAVGLSFAELERQYNIAPEEVERYRLD